MEDFKLPRIDSKPTLLVSSPKASRPASPHVSRPSSPVLNATCMTDSPVEAAPHPPASRRVIRPSIRNIEHHLDPHQALAVPHYLDSSRSAASAPLSRKKSPLAPGTSAVFSLFDPKANAKMMQRVDSSTFTLEEVCNLKPISPQVRKSTAHQPYVNPLLYASTRVSDVSSSDPRPPLGNELFVSTSIPTLSDSCSSPEDFLVERQLYSQSLQEVHSGAIDFEADQTIQTSISRLPLQSPYGSTSSLHALPSIVIPGLRPSSPQITQSQQSSSLHAPNAHQAIANHSPEKSRRQIMGRLRANTGPAVLVHENTSPMNRTALPPIQRGQPGTRKQLETIAPSDCEEDSYRFVDRGSSISRSHSSNQQRSSTTAEPNYVRRRTKEDQLCLQHQKLDEIECQRAQQDDDDEELPAIYVATEDFDVETWLNASDHSDVATNGDCDDGGDNDVFEYEDLGEAIVNENGSFHVVRKQPKIKMQEMVMIFDLLFFEQVSDVANNVLLDFGLRSPRGVIRDNSAQHQRKDQETKANESQAQTQSQSQLVRPSALSFILQRRADNGSSTCQEKQQTQQPSALEFLEKYCVLSPEQMTMSNDLFDKLDIEHEGVLSFNQLIKAVHLVSKGSFSLEEAEYCLNLLELLDEATSYKSEETSREKKARMNKQFLLPYVDRRIFALVVCLSQRLYEQKSLLKPLLCLPGDSLNKRVKMIKDMFYFHADPNNGSIQFENLSIELRAAGYDDNRLLATIQMFQKSGLNSLPFFDYLAFSPLFLETHSLIIKQTRDGQATQ